jgi:hypothetical protein
LRTNSKWVFFALFVLILGVNAIVNNPLSLSRFWFFGAIVGFMWLIFPLVHVFFRILYVVGMPGSQFVILPWFSQLTRQMGGIEYTLVSLRDYLNHGDFDGFQTITNCLILISEQGFFFGKNILSVMLFYIPRTMWASKAEPLGVVAADYMGYSFTNLSAPLYVELYADFGLISLVGGFWCLGHYVRKLDDSFNKLVSVGHIGVLTLMVCIFAGYITILMRGSLLGVISGIASLFLVVSIGSYLGGKKYSA